MLHAHINKDGVDRLVHDSVDHGKQLFELTGRMNALSHRITDTHDSAYSRMSDIENDLDTRMRSVEKKQDEFQKQTLNQMNSIMTEVQKLRERIEGIESACKPANTCTGPCSWEQHQHIPNNFDSDIPCPKCINVMAYKIGERFGETTVYFNHVESEINRVHGRVNLQAGVNRTWFENMRNVRSSIYTQNGHVQAFTAMLGELLSKIIQMETRLNGNAGDARSSD